MRKYTYMNVKIKSHLVSYFRNFIFGVEDSLVSTVGLLSGIAIAEISREAIFLTGVVLIFVEAFSMAAGSYLSEHSVAGYTKTPEGSEKHNLISGVIMFFSYFISGFFPLFPYLFWKVDIALPISILISVVALFVLGLIGARISRIGLIKNGIRMALIGGIAIGIGLLAGTTLSSLNL